MSRLFEVSTRLHYGMVFMAELAASHGTPEPVSLQKLCRESGFMSEAYLEEVAAAFRAVGLIQGVRGRHGGYRLAKDPQDISVENIVTALEGPVTLVSCQNGSPDACPMERRCASKDLWQHVRSGLSATLRGMTLRDVVSAK
ncbi:Rrf2 family transcriptional regulator [Candidatus Uhrbacteria bacterium]|nr:Rrf2 family transcriptional regulator [Candidatus Uhrbacteria bacterium]